MSQTTTTSPDNTKTKTKTKTAGTDSSDIDNDVKLAYLEWVINNAEGLACASSEAKTNPAWNDPRASEEDKLDAQGICLNCPVIRDCGRMLRSPLFENFEGVMAARVLVDPENLS